MACAFSSQEPCSQEQRLILSVAAPHPLENIMAYTVEHLDRSWNLVRCENMINWIGDRVETGYAFFRSRMSLNLGDASLGLGGSGT